MINRLRISGAIIFLLLIFLIHSCKKDDDSVIKDGDGNIYTSIVIGTQVWMVENLKTTHFKNGTDIPLIIDGTAWSSLSTPGYCWYNSDESAYKNIYGALYNWFTVKTGNLCPTGWHVPTQDEWITLSNYLVGGNVAGKMKETGTAHWSSTNAEVTNESGFTALPGGYRYNDGKFDFMGINAFWWSVTTSNADWAYSREVDIDYSDFFEFNDPKKAGFSVRCLRD
ncbi:MAG TPA: fibrobacter succinogenes major paralogous domain-containing protein [Bacteroidales bacterium]|nr:fibrobacter succinogenes major paralogous domain-containing protein [Bacteroidales bacterium]